MKKNLLLIAVAVATVAACSQEQLKPETPDSGEVTIFTGSFNATRISMGEKVGSAYKALWEAGDELSVYDASTSALLGTATLVSGEGTNNGVFSMSSPVSDGTAVILKYGTEGGVATEQTQSRAGASSFESYTSATSGSVTVTAGKATFTMSHNPAVIRVCVDAASSLIGGTVSKVILRCIGGTVSGADKDYVRVTLSTPLTLSAESQDVWMTANASDLTGKEIDIAFEITKSGETFTLPVGFAGMELEANKVTKFAVTSLADAKCVPWYEPHDSRLMAGAGYAYGPANTFFIQCKSGYTYTGGSYSPNAGIPDEVAISIKARGDFLKVINPKGCTFDWARMGAIDSGTKNGAGSVYVTRLDKGLSAIGVDPTQYSKSYDGNYTVTVTNTGAYAGTPILLMMKDSKIVWAWSFWNIAADGTTVGTIDIGGKDLCDMVIGQASNVASWPVAILQCLSYYQWGRPIPMFWNSYPSVRAAGTSTTGVTPIIQGKLDIETAAQQPVGCIVGYTNTNISNWCSSTIYNLWGSPDNKLTNTGTKSIYDPCPKGWRVADPAGYIQSSIDLYNSAITVTYSNVNNKHGVTPSSAPEATLFNGGFFTGVISKDTPETSGCLVGSQGTGLDGSNNSTANDNGRYWTNTISGDNQAYAFMFSSKTTATGNSTGLSTGNYRGCTQNKTCSVPVRCQVDTDNR